MGSIMTVVEVLLTHMEMMAVAIMAPRTSMRGLVPTRERTMRAKRRGRPQRSMATPIIMPPMKKKMVGSA